MIPLEKLFNLDDVVREPQFVPNFEYIEELNIGTKEQPKNIKIASTLKFESKQRYISLMKEYSDVFAWSYKDLKAYDTGIIQHIIAIKKDEMSFK